MDRIQTPSKYPPPIRPRDKVTVARRTCIVRPLLGAVNAWSPRLLRRKGRGDSIHHSIHPNVCSWLLGTRTISVRGSGRSGKTIRAVVSVRGGLDAEEDVNSKTPSHTNSRIHTPMHSIDQTHKNSKRHHLDVLTCPQGPHGTLNQMSTGVGEVFESAMLARIRYLANRGGL